MRALLSDRVRATKGRDMSILRPTRLLKICGFAFFSCVQSCACSADQLPAPAAKLIEFEGDLPFTPKPVILKGYLRRPDAAGRHPAIVLLHGCGGAAERLDQIWGRRLASWGFVTLTIDRKDDICSVRNFPPLQDFDAYRGLNFLARQPFVDAGRVVVIGLQQGGSLALYSVERGAIEQIYENRFRAAVAFYPVCYGQGHHGGARAHSDRRTRPVDPGLPRHGGRPRRRFWLVPDPRRGRRRPARCLPQRVSRVR